MPMYCNNFELEESRDDFLLRAEPPEAFAMYPNSNPGPPGPPGPAGPGVAEGGTTGQLLAKTSDEDFDTEWIDPPELDAGHVTYDDTETYEDGTVGAELQNLAINKADVIVSSASGAIASFPDGMAAPIKGMVVDIDPIQDLHGQDAPYPPGGGKNICPIATMNTTNGGYINLSTGVVGTVVAGEQYTFSFKNNTTSTANLSVRINVNGSWVTLAEGNLVSQGSTSYTFTPANSGDISLSAYLGADYTPAFSELQLEKGSTATPFAPFANNCPISGHTGLTGYRTGVNVWDEEVDKGYYWVSSGTKTEHTGRSCSKNFISVKPETTYYVKSFNSAPNVLFRFFDINKTQISATDWIIASQGYSLTTPANCVYMVFTFASNIDYNANLTINYPSTDHDYHAYTGTTYPITFPSEAGTVYGCTLQVNEDGSGVLTVGRAYAQWTGAQSEEYTRDTGDYGYRFRCAYSDADQTSGRKSVLCNRGVFSGGNTVGTVFLNVGQIYYYPPSSVTTIEEFKTWLSTNNLQFVYPLATPLVYTLTAEQVGAVISTLYGQNNFWVSSGDVSLDYRADTAKYIQKLIASLS